MALKAALYKAWRQAGISQRRLARDLDVAKSEVRRMLNPEHSTKAATIDRALRRLGKRVTVNVGEATPELPEGHWHRDNRLIGQYTRTNP